MLILLLGDAQVGRKEESEKNLLLRICFSSLKAFFMLRVSDATDIELLSSLSLCFAFLLLRNDLLEKCIEKCLQRSR